MLHVPARGPDKRSRSGKRRIGIVSTMPFQPVDRELDNSVPARAPEISRRLTHHPKPVPIPLPNDIVSKGRREEALRARGLLPSRDLSAIEADQDRRIDALCSKSNFLSSSYNTHSGANDIAQAWRIRNSTWLSESLPNLDTSKDPMTEGSQSCPVHINILTPIFVPILFTQSLRRQRRRAILRDHWRY